MSAPKMLVPGRETREELVLFFPVAIQDAEELIKDDATGHPHRFPKDLKPHAAGGPKTVFVEVAVDQSFGWADQPERLVTAIAKADKTIDELAEQFRDRQSVSGIYWDARADPRMLYLRLAEHYEGMVAGAARSLMAQTWPGAQVEWELWDYYSSMAKGEFWREAPLGSNGDLAPYLESFAEKAGDFAESITRLAEAKKMLNSVGERVSSDGIIAGLDLLHENQQQAAKAARERSPEEFDRALTDVVLRNVMSGMRLTDDTILTNPAMFAAALRVGAKDLADCDDQVELARVLRPLVHVAASVSRCRLGVAAEREIYMTNLCDLNGAEGLFKRAPHLASLLSEKPAVSPSALEAARKPPVVDVESVQTNAASTGVTTTASRRRPGWPGSRR